MSENILESSKLYELWAWYEANRKRVHLWATIILIVGIAIAYAVWSAKQKQLNANNAVFLLGEPVSVIADGKVPGDELMKVADKYKGTSAAERALLEAGSAYFNAGEYQKAEDAFKRFQSEYPGSDMKNIAAYGLAVCLDAAGKDDAALSAYQTLSRENNAVALQAKMNMAAIYQSKGDNEQAVEIYREISSTHQSSWAGKAYAQVRKMETRFPELVKKPEPPKTETTANKAPETSVKVPPMLAAPAEETAKEVKEAVKETAETAKETAKEVAKEVKETAEKAVDAAKEAAKDATEAVKEAAKDTTDAAKEAAKEVKEAVTPATPDKK
ncbi:MAG: tetratricopeptide repeat protein [Verrucomicrobia bacterium]|nr:tetratricopeptide repeat protein [Verrucomicrobiota bacterium]MBR5978587.1 tetratricopeptide repeat protein [Verrucomicrobiota bacterium]MBR6460816.1 tetratricopeptide repeat protein [Verrucomicrobiota bacterium]MBR6464791.1 tetratricopeptide repeat protein [Verrucomicrobiota bacterium]